LEFFVAKSQRLYTFRKQVATSSLPDKVNFMILFGGGAGLLRCARKDDLTEFSVISPRSVIVANAVKQFKISIFGKNSCSTTLNADYLRFELFL